jgi:lipopolysaccharide transport system permease protein
MRGPVSVPTTVRLVTALPVLARSLRAHRFILRTLVRNEILTRYSKTILGVVWSMINPLVMIAIYSFVFGLIFEVRFGRTAGTSEVPYGIVLFSGLLLHVFMAETLLRAQSVVLDNPNYVKRVIFPLEILPIGILLANIIQALIALGVLMAVILIAGFPIPRTAFLIPIVWAPLILVTLGLAMIVASLGVFVRDIGQVLGFMMTILMFGSSILFPVDMLPEPLRPWLLLNPLTIIVDQTRAVLLWGELPNWRLLGYHAVVSLVIAWIGCWWFMRTRRGFADVM